MSDVQVDSQLWELAEAVCADRITDHELEQLNERLQGNPAAQQQYLDFCKFHASLLECVSADRAIDLAIQAIDEQANSHAAEPTDLIHPARRARWWSPAVDVINRNSTASMLVSGLFVTTILLLLAMWTLPEPLNQRVERPLTAESFVAEITRFERTTWDQASDGDFKSRSLFVGDRLILKRGLAEITYYSGARVTLEGPAEYEVLGINSGHLHNGQLVARIASSRAKGFTIDTLAARVVDLGTEFGVRVGPDEPVVVQTFKGLVTVTSAAGGPTLRVSANEFVHVSTDGHVSVVQTGNPQKVSFVRTLPTRDSMAPTNRFLSSVEIDKDRFVEADELWYISRRATMAFHGNHMNGRIFVASKAPPNGNATLTIAGGGTLHVGGGRGGLCSLRLGHLAGTGVGSLVVRDDSTVRIDHRLFASGEGGVIDLIDGTLIVSNEQLGRPWRFADFKEARIELRANGVAQREAAFSFKQLTGELAGYTSIQHRVSQPQEDDTTAE